jgi:hypothetical protein
MNPIRFDPIGALIALAFEVPRDIKFNRNNSSSTTYFTKFTFEEPSENRVSLLPTLSRAGSFSYSKCSTRLADPRYLAIGGPDSRFGRYDQEIVASLRFGRPIRDSGPRVPNRSIFRYRG